MTDARAEHAERRRLAEEAAAAHGAKVRRRLTAAAATAAVVAGAVVAAWQLELLPRGPLADAADRFEATTARMRFDLSGAASGGSASLSGEGVTAGDGSRAELKGTFTGSGGEPLPATILAVGDDRWMRSQQLDLPPGKAWLHVAPEDDPLALSPVRVAAMLDHADRASAGSRQRVLGRQATHYTAALDVDELVADSGGATAERFEQQFGDADAELPMEVWLTDDGLPLLLRLDLGDGTAQLRVEIEALEYGVPVDVAAPPAASVAESATRP